MWFRRVLLVILTVDFLLKSAFGNQQRKHGPFVYDREQLLELQQQSNPDLANTIPDELSRTNDGFRGFRGCRGKGRRARKRRAEARRERRRYKPYIPAVIMGNVRSLANKMDELTALAGSQKEYRECSIMCFSETWLHSDIPDSNVSIDGFQTVRADRTRTSGKQKGGGLALFINKRFCNPSHVTIKERHCDPNIEMLAVGLRPYYLPREIPHVIMMAVYIPPSANPASASDVINSATARLQTKHPKALILISGDFNHVTLGKSLPNFVQYVKCPTREHKTLDLLYANVKNAYSSSPLPQLGRSDHNLVLLSPCYVPLVRREPVTNKSVRRWSEEAYETLQGCFEVTDWQALCDPHGEDLDMVTECVTDYINFCVDSNVPTRTVTCFPNNKPWITKDIKALLNVKKRAFIDGDREEVKRVQGLLKVKLRQAKGAYSRKLESKLENENLREVWNGMKVITGLKPAGGGGVVGDVLKANELNLFYNRFDTAAQTCTCPSPVTPACPPNTSTGCPPAPSPKLLPPPPSQPPYNDPPSPPPLPESSPPPSTVCLSVEQVKTQLMTLKASKAAGPDGIYPGVLKACAIQLCGVLQYIFNMSLRLQKVPTLWKTSCVVPVPKCTRPSVSKDYRPVALTSHAMKTMERLVLEELRPAVKPHLDPLQFAYQPRLGVEDAVIYLTNRAFSHLESPASTVRVIFFDFSSAFDTIRPGLLGDKLTAMKVDAPLVSWIVDYLTGRPQYVRLRDCVSDKLISNTGAPQGTVLSPFLFTVYTNDFSYKTESCHLQKFSDDSAIVGCIKDGDEEEYRAVVDTFVSWCDRNHLQLNVSKTKELVVDLGRRRSTQVTPVSIRGADTVDIVDDYKYLGVHIDNKLNWSKHSEALYKKGQSRLYFLRRLRSFNICTRMLKMFYESVVAGAFLFAVACWSGGMRAADYNRLDKLVKKASDVVGVRLDSLAVVAERRSLSKFHAIMRNTSHPLYTDLAERASTFSGRLRLPKCRTERYRKSFIPTAIRLHNASL